MSCQVHPTYQVLAMLDKAVNRIFLYNDLHSEELRREINGKSERRYNCNKSYSLLASTFSTFFRPVVTGLWKINAFNRKTSESGMGHTALGGWVVFGTTQWVSTPAPMSPSDPKVAIRSAFVAAPFADAPANHSFSRRLDRQIGRTRRHS